MVTPVSTVQLNCWNPFTYSKKVKRGTKGRSDGSSMFSRAKCSKQLRVAFRVALVISYSSSSLEWLLAGRVAGPQTLFRCQYLRRGVETIPLEIAKELNLSITFIWGIKPILSFFSIPTLLFIGGSSDGWHISVTIVEQGSRSLWMKPISANEIDAGVGESKLED